MSAKANPADRPATEPRHNGCATCPRRWSDHTLAETMSSTHRPEAAQRAAPRQWDVNPPSVADLYAEGWTPDGDTEMEPIPYEGPGNPHGMERVPVEGAAPRAEGLDVERPMNGAEKLLDAVDWEPLPPMEAKDGELYATHHGYLTIGAIRLKCYTLNNGQRVFDADSVHQLFSDERVPESEEPR